MNSDFNRRRQRVRFEAILDGRSTSADSLSDLIAAAAQPPSEAELVSLAAGLDAAAAVFAASDGAAPAGDSTTAVTPVTSAGRRRALTGKLAAAVAGIVAVGGVAYATTTAGQAHNANPGASSSARANAGSKASSSHADAGEATASASRSASTDPSPTDSGSAASVASGASTLGAHPTHSATPSPSLVGLCRAWLARPTDAGRADESAAFTVLVTAAGGKDSVNSYCTSTVLPAAASAHATPAGGANTRSKGRPNPLPTPSHPAGPTTHPGGQPSSLPTQAAHATPTHPAPAHPTPTHP